MFNRKPALQTGEIDCIIGNGGCLFFFFPVNPFKQTSNLYIPIAIEISQIIIFLDYSSNVKREQIYCAH